VVRNKPLPEKFFKLIPIMSFTVEAIKCLIEITNSTFREMIEIIEEILM